MKKHKLAELVFDFDLYPRGSVDAHHVTEIASAIEAGVELPPLVIDKKSRRVTDGFHRGRAYIRVYDENHEVVCIEKDYKSEQEMLLDAMRYNASHGRALTQHDKAHCLILAKRFKIPEMAVAEALNLTTGRVEALTATRIGTAAAKTTGGKATSRPIALKRTIKHMAGKRLTMPQQEANRKLSGMNQAFYANQLITLLENGLVDPDSDGLMQAFGRLHQLLGQYLKAAA